MTEPYDPLKVSYLEQEGVSLDEHNPFFSCFIAEDWSPLPELFLYDTFLDSPSASLATNIVTPTFHSPSEELTESQYDVASHTEDEGGLEGGLNTPGLDVHDAVSDITSTVMSTAEEEHGPGSVQEQSLDRPTSYGKVSMAVKSSRGNLLKCKWKHCEYSGGFSQMAALLRHIKTKHISPGLFECPEGECRKSFNRKDNLVAHVRNVHRANV